jgi:hypothetical protein
MFKKCLTFGLLAGLGGLIGPGRGEERIKKLNKS